MQSKVENLEQELKSLSSLKVCYFKIVWKAVIMIGWMRKHNRAARATRTSAHSIEVICQTTSWNFRIEGFKPGFHMIAPVAPIARTVYRRSKRLYGNSDGKLRDDRGDRDDRDRPDRTLLYPGDWDDRVKFTCDHMETVNRPDRLHTISSDRGHWGDRGDYMETRLYLQHEHTTVNISFSIFTSTAPYQSLRSLLCQHYR